MSAARPLARITTAVEHALRLVAWGTQASVAAIYLAITAQPDAWRPLYAKDPTGAICGAASLLSLTFLWAACLYAEQRSFYDRAARRVHRQIGLLAHAGVLAFALGAVADKHNWLMLGAIPVVFTSLAAVVWHAWMHSLALPAEDQAVIDVIINQEAREAATRFDAGRKEHRRERLNAIVTGLGYRLADIEPKDEGDSSEVADADATAPRPWRIPPRKHEPLVYLLRNGNRIKIGTTTELKRRIRTLSLRPENVVLLLNGGQQLERELHHRFAGLRIGNTEWFTYDGPLIDFVHAENARATQREGRK